MTNTERVKLARTIAAARGWSGRRGGWIYDRAGKPIAQVWLALLDLLEARGFVTERGIWWRRMDLANFH